MNRQNWLYQIRGIAIIAIVICHQQFILHTYEWVQFLALYAVTISIFCTDITQMLWLLKHGKFQNYTLSPEL